MSAGAFVRRVLGGGPPAPVLTPAQRIAEERRQADAARAAAEQVARAVEIERRRLAHEQLLEICARNHGWYFPGDHSSSPSEYLGRWRRDGGVLRLQASAGGERRYAIDAEGNLVVIDRDESEPYDPSPAADATGAEL